MLDEQFLRVMRQYQTYCRKAAAGGVCGACGIAGLANGGNSIPLKKLRFFILRTDQHSTSRYAKFVRELQHATSAKDRAIARFKLDSLHTYEHRRNVYHLFEEGVVQVNGVTCCSTCSTCHTALQNLIEKVDKWEDNIVIRLSKAVDEETILPDNSVVYPPPKNTFSDWDFGRIIMEYVDEDGRRQPLKPLSPIERQALCKLVVGADIHEVQDAMDVNFACRLKGQTIVMPCNIAEMLHEYRVQTLPRRDLVKWVKILFQGRKNCYTTKMSADLNRGRARMDYDQVRCHLLRLQQLGVYSDITIASKTDCNWDENKSLIQEDVVVLNDRRAEVAQAARSSDTARQWETDCLTRQAPGAPSQADFSVVMSTEATTSSANSDRNLAIAFVALAAGEKGPNAVSDADVDTNDEAHLADSDTKTVKTIVENDPINEFTHMPQILSGAFPHEFPFGVSLTDLGGPASLKKRVLRRMTRLYDGRVSHNYHLLVYLGDMILRHKSIAATSAKVELDCAQPLVNMINRPEWEKQASEIVKNPDGEVARDVVKKMSQWVRLAGRKVPWSPMERLSAGYQLYALFHHLGSASHFITLAPKTLTNQLMLRFGTFQDRTRDCDEYADLDLPEHLQNRVKLLTSNTIAQARAYEVILTAVCTVLFGIKPESDCKKTHKPVPGLFGTVTAYFGVTECQSRNALHAHFELWVRTLHPDVVQRFAHDPVLRKTLVNAVDAAVTASTEHYEECLPPAQPVVCEFNQKPYGIRFEAMHCGRSVRITGTTKGGDAEKLKVHRGLHVQCIDGVDVTNLRSEVVRDMIVDRVGPMAITFAQKSNFDPSTGKLVSASVDTNGPAVEDEVIHSVVPSSRSSPSSDDIPNGTTLSGSGRRERSNADVSRHTHSVSGVVISDVSGVVSASVDTNGDNEATSNTASADTNSKDDAINNVGSVISDVSGVVSASADTNGDDEATSNTGSAIFDVLGVVSASADRNGDDEATDNVGSVIPDMSGVVSASTDTNDDAEATNNVASVILTMSGVTSPDTNGDVDATNNVGSVISDMSGVESADKNGDDEATKNVGSAVSDNKPPHTHEKVNTSTHKSATSAKRQSAAGAPAFLDNILNFDFDNRTLQVGDVFFDGDNGEDSGVDDYTLGWVEVIAKRGSKIYLSPVYAPAPPLIAKDIREMPVAAVMEIFKPCLKTRTGRSLKLQLQGRHCWEWSASLAGQAAALHRCKVRGMLVMMSYNVHGFPNGKRHTHTCHKYKDTFRAKWCRLGFGRSVFEQTDFRQVVEKTRKGKVGDDTERNFEEAMCELVDQVEIPVPRSPPTTESCVYVTPEKGNRPPHVDYSAIHGRRLFQTGKEDNSAVPCSPGRKRRRSAESV